MADPITGADLNPAGASPATGGSPAPVSPAAVPSSAGTIAPSAAPGVPPATPQGPIPFEDHQRILANTRKEYEWLGDRKREDIETMESWYQFADRDPVAFLRFFADTLRSDPVYAPQLDSLNLAGPAPGAREPARTTPADLLSQIPPDYTGPQGEPVYGPRAMAAVVQMLQQQMDERIDTRLGERVGPIETSLTEQQRAVQIRESVRQDLDRMSKWPLFNDPDIQKEVLRLMKTERLPAPAAYGEAMRTVGEAKLRQQIHAEKLAGFQTEANAATERSSTGTAAGVKADRDKLWGDLIAEKMNAGR